MSVSQEEAIPELEIDVDELLDMENDADRAARVKVSFHIKSSGLQIITFLTYNYKMYTFDSGDVFQILYMYMVCFVIQQDLLVDCYKPTEVSP